MAIRGVLSHQHPTAGYEIGTGLGRGLSAALQGLVEGRVNDMQWQKALPGLQSLGFTSQQAQQLQHLPEQTRNAIIQYKLEEPNRMAFQQALQQTLGGQQQEPTLVDNLGQLGISTENQQRQPNAQEAEYIKSLSSPFTSPLYNKMPGATPSYAQPQVAQQQAQQQPQIQAQQMQQQAAEQQKQPQGFFQGGLNAQQAIQLAQIQQQREQIAGKEAATHFKETKEVREAILNEARTAKDSLRDLNRMQELNEEGKLDTPGYNEFLKRSGLDIPALMNPESQEFGKIAQNFLRDAKTYYGGRVSNFEVEQFLKTIPSLSQTPEGRKRVIANLKNMANAKLAYADTMLEIIKQNKGIPPLDLSEQIYERIDKKLDKLAEVFKKDLERGVPKGQNALLTAAQALGGSIVGAPGKLLNKAAGAIGHLTGG